MTNPTIRLSPPPYGPRSTPTANILHSSSDPPTLLLGNRQRHVSDQHEATLFVGEPVEVARTAGTCYPALQRRGDQADEPEPRRVGQDPQGRGERLRLGLGDGRLQCDLCPRFCKLHEGQRGLCVAAGTIRSS